MPLTQVELVRILGRARGKGEPLTKRELERLGVNLIRKYRDTGLESNQEKIVLSGLILYDPRKDCSDSKNADKRNRYIQRAWENLCRRSE